MGIKRIVLFKIKKGTPQNIIDSIFSKLSGLKTSIPGVEDFVHGAYSGSDNLNQGFTHAFILTFHDAAARDRFGPHAEHQKAVNFLSPHVEGVLAFDF